jgi:hypothetical protein
LRLYRLFTDGIPVYLARHYWWAYLWRPAAWFFDHQPVINAILFGQYKKLMRTTLALVEQNPKGLTLQLTCAYGCLTLRLSDKIAPDNLHITDVAALQINRVQHKLPPRLIATRMNSERLGYRDNSFAVSLYFFCSMKCRLKHATTHSPNACAHLNPQAH